MFRTKGLWARQLFSNDSATHACCMCEHVWACAHTSVHVRVCSRACVCGVRVCCVHVWVCVHTSLCVHVHACVPVCARMLCACACAHTPRKRECVWQVLVAGNLGERHPRHGPACPAFCTPAHPYLPIPPPLFTSSASRTEVQNEK